LKHLLNQHTFPVNKWPKMTGKTQPIQDDASHLLCQAKKHYILNMMRNSEKRNWIEFVA